MLYIWNGKKQVLIFTNGPQEGSDQAVVSALISNLVSTGKQKSQQWLFLSADDLLQMLTLVEVCKRNIASAFSKILPTAQNSLNQFLHDLDVPLMILNLSNYLFTLLPIQGHMCLCLQLVLAPWGFQSLTSILQYSLKYTMPHTMRSKTSAFQNVT